jgi:diguanylate cyclase (GGDEF)-like protein
MKIPYEQIIEQSALSLKQIRLLIIIGTMLLAMFMIADFALLPDSLKSIYAKSRLAMQFPVCGLFLLSSFHPSFLKHYQKILFVVMACITYINYGLIIACWEMENFSFPYEGAVMYSLFTLFVFRMSFKYAVWFSITIVLGFAVVIFSYPIYGAQSTVNLGFVFTGSLVGLLGIYQIESALKKLSRANVKLEILSQTDSLTGLYNRRTYETRFSEQLCLNKRTGNSIGVFIIDLDFFKDYNDGYGHVQGDEVIRLQAEHLASIFRREADIVARYGGEEFVVITSPVTYEKCVDFANTIIKKWAAEKIPHGKGQAGSYVSCSIGLYVAKIKKDSDKNLLVKEADKALYEAKKQGRNGFVGYKES